MVDMLLSVLGAFIMIRSGIIWGNERYDHEKKEKIIGRAGESAEQSLQLENQQDKPESFD